MPRRGGWLLGRWHGAPIKLHWSIGLGLLVFSGFRWNPGFFLAYPCLILVHELGHAWLVRRTGHRVVAIEITGLGGECHWSGNASPFEESLIAWGGVLAQLMLLAVTLLWLRFLPPTSAFGQRWAATFTDTNLWLIAFNLLPIGRLDGARAWRVFGAFRRRDSATLPHGTWRDHSPSVQRAWFDKLQSKPPTPVRDPKPDSEEAAEGPLSAEAQRAIDRLLKSVTGNARDRKARDREDGD